VTAPAAGRHHLEEIGGSQRLNVFNRKPPVPFYPHSIALQQRT